MALIYTTKGDIEESMLTRTIGGFENDTEIVSWQEYYLNGELVKRDAQVHIKQPAVSVSDVAGF